MDTELHKLRVSKTNIPICLSVAVSVYLSAIEAGITIALG